MSDRDKAGPRSRGGAAKRQAAKPPGGARRSGAKTLRMQLHLEEQTVERLRVHTALSHRGDSATVNEILLKWLAQYGKGRELFGPLEAAGQDPVELPDTGEIGQEGAAA